MSEVERPAGLPPAVAVMAKLPGLEPAKSRLHPAVPHEMAALLARCFLLDRLDGVASLAGITPVFAFSPPWAGAQAAALAPPSFRLMPQRGADLGERMSGALDDLLAAGHTGALVVGTDSPTLPMAYVAEGAQVLAGGAADVVVGPAEDGGYYLIGVRRAQPALFSGIPWSTGGVMTGTVARARALGIRVHLLPTWFDVDTGSDLRRLRADLAAGVAVPRRTARCLAALSI